MQKSNSDIGLRNAILELENKRDIEGKLLKEQLLLSFERIKPINIIKSALNELTFSQNLIDQTVNIGIGLSAGYVSKILFERISNSRGKKLLGTAMMFGITSFIAKNPEIVKSLGRAILETIRSKSDARAHKAG